MTSHFKFNVHISNRNQGVTIYPPSENKKLKFLPNWLNKYGKLLKKESLNNLPNYYRKFSQGTIVKVDFGARVGSEMSLNHFCVVLSKNDTQYDRNIIVVPLSSKAHDSYLPLGKELFKQALNLIKVRIDDLQKKIDEIIKEMENIPSKIVFEFNSEEENNYLKEIMRYESFNLNESVDAFKFKDSDCYKLYLKIINSNDYQNFDTINEFVNTVNTVSQQLDNLTKDLKQLNDELKSLVKLQNSLENYNVETYADVGNITTVSKLRVTKFSKYNLSENISFNKNILDKIKDRLNDFI